MNIERFTELVEAYGAQSSRWPDAERTEAVAFMDANPAEAALVLAPAQSLDAALETGRQSAGSTDFLAARILKAAQAESAAPVAANDRPPARAPWKSIAATLVITTGMGFSIGQSAAAKSARIADAETLLSLTLDNPYDSADIWEDL